GNLIARREEFACEISGDEGVDREVVPLEHIADHRGGHGPPRLRCLRIHCSLPRAPEKSAVSPVAPCGRCFGQCGTKPGGAQSCSKRRIVPRYTRWLHGCFTAGNPPFNCLC